MRMEISDLPERYAKRVLEQIAAQTARANTAQDPKTHKYHNQPDIRGDLRFDSRKEARRYDELLAMEAAGQIRRLRLQQDFTLQEAFTTPSGDRIRAIRYRADFVYERCLLDGGVWELVVEDVKSRGTRTRDYLMKKKMMQDVHGISIEEV